MVTDRIERDSQHAEGRGVRRGMRRSHEVPGAGLSLGWTRATSFLEERALPRLGRPRVCMKEGLVDVTRPRGGGRAPVRGEPGRADDPAPALAEADPREALALAVRRA